MTGRTSHAVVRDGQDVAHTVVAFAGHARAEDVGDPGRAGLAVDTAFAMVRDAARTRMMLLTGNADGADALAAGRWRSGGFGPLSRVHAFVGDGTGESDDDADEGGGDVWLDGASSARLALHPHLERTRWLVAHADVLIALWSGKPARGPGGTGDAVQLALDAGVAVLWVGADDGSLHLIDPRLIGAHRSVREVVAARATPAPTVASVRLLLASRAVPQVGVAGERQRASPLWRGDAWFRRVAGGRAPVADPAEPPPADLAQQPGFRQLSEAFHAIDEAAARDSATHRSEQLILIGLAIAAAAAGASPALWPGIAIAAAAVELLLAFTAFLVWWYADRGRGRDRWREVRHFAEELRIARAAWALGIRGGPGARALPGVAPPVGRFDARCRAAWARWALGELIGGRRAFHRRSAHVDHRISLRLHTLGGRAFALLLGVLILFIVAYAVAHARDVPLPGWAGGVVLMTGVMIPALGAAAMAMEARLGFRAQAQRSTRVVQRLDALATAGDQADPRVQASEAIAILRAETGSWRETGY